jgi:uncharacterized protein (TIGR03435 family)
MKTLIATVGLTLLTSSFAFSSPAPEALSFEVASVKIAEPPKPDAQGRLMIMRGCRGGPGPNTTDPGTMTCTNTPLHYLLVKAYGVKNYQVEGPAWIDTDGYDIVAKVPAGTTVDQFNQMLQTLLTERFKVTLHRENKAMQAYVLSVGKGGPKMKELDAAAIEKLKADAEAAAASGQASGPMKGMPPIPAGATTMMMTSDTGGGRAMGGPGGPPMGIPQRPKGLAPNSSMSMGNGHMQRSVSGYITMTQLTASLASALDRPVTDLTELKGTYDIDLTWVPDGNDSASMMKGMPAMVMATGDRGTSDASDPGGFNLPQSLQAALGLKLEQKKAPIEVLIIDRAEKVPTEN